MVLVGDLRNTSSAISNALSSSFDCSTIPHIWVMITGQKKSMEITVGIACCPQMPTPASKYMLPSCGDKVTFNAVFIPNTALNTPPFVIEIS